MSLYTLMMLLAFNSISQIKYETTGKTVDLDSILHNWEKHFNKIPEVYVWTNGGPISIPTLKYVNRSDTDYYQLPFKGISSFTEVGNLKITNKDSALVVTKLIAETPNWAPEILETYSMAPYSYANIKFKFSGNLRVYYMPYLNDFYYVEMLTTTSVYGTKEGMKSHVFYELQSPLRGFVKKELTGSLSSIFSNLVGGGMPFHVSPSIIKNSMYLEKKYFVSEEDRAKITWGN